MSEGKGRVLLTGGSGYLGGNLLRRLLTEGCEVAAIVRPSTNRAAFPAGATNLRLCEWDGSARSMREIVEEVQPRTVFHLASLFLTRHRAEDILPMLQSNLALGTVLLDACVRGRPENMPCFVNVSTHWLHFNEEPYNPVNLYAATKKAFEDVLQYYVRAHGLHAVTLHLLDTYGPFDPRGKVISLFRRIARSGETLPMSPGGQEMGLLYVDDAVRAFLLAAERARRQPFAAFVAAPPAIYTLRQTAKIFSRVSGRALRIEWGGQPYREREMMRAWRGEENILSGSSALDLPEGLARMFMLEPLEPGGKGASALRR